MSRPIRLVKQNKVLVIKNVRTDASLSALTDRVGWVRIVSINVPSGSTANEVYEDPPANTILQSVDVSDGTFNVVVESSYPTVTVGGNTTTIPLVGSVYRGSVSVTITADGDVVAEATDPDGNAAAVDTVAVRIDAPPQLLTFSFSGGYPGSQTELKAGDTYQLIGTLDKPADAIEVQATDASDSVQLLTFPSGTSFIVTMTIGDRGNVTTSFPANARARSTVTGNFGAIRSTNELAGNADGTDTVLLNNTYPTINITGIAYPGAQQALKGSEQAQVTNTILDFDTVLYDSPVAELSIANDTTQENPKTVTRIAGAYNVSVDNFRITANRAANDATSVESSVVQIAAVAPIITVTEPFTRLRSGGNDGTAPQVYTITITSNQELNVAPLLLPQIIGPGTKGTFTGPFTGGPLVWTAPFQVTDNDEKGVFQWFGLLATNIAVIATNIITGDDTYTLGGFVPRNVTFPPFSSNSSINTKVSDFSKLQAGIFTATSNASIKQAIGTGPSVTDGYTIAAAGVSPTTIIWLDTPAVSSNSSGTAQLLNIEEIA